MIITEKNASSLKFGDKTEVTVVLQAGNDFSNRMTNVPLAQALAAMPRLVNEVAKYTKSVTNFKANAYGASANFTDYTGKTLVVRMYIYKD